jgi:Na+/glutamate symporter
MREAFSCIAALAFGCRVTTPAEMIATSGTRVTSPVALMSSRVPVIGGMGSSAAWAATDVTGSAAALSASAIHMLFIQILLNLRNEGETSHRRHG